MAVFEELKRRRVFRAAVAYIVASWVILQVADVVFPIIQLPEYVMRGLLWVLVLSFPVVVLVSWLFRRAPGGGVERERGSRQTAAMLGLALGSLIIGLGLGWVWSGLHQSQPERGGGGSTGIAVLPLEDLSPQGDKAYFSDGMQEELIARLAQIDGLSVPSRTTMEGYRDSTLNARQIADELGVDYILEGSVRHGGERVRITLQLIDSENDEHVWVRNFDELLTMESLFRLQGEVAKDIAARLRAQLTASELVRIDQAPTQVLEAYESYLRGSYHYRQFNSQDLRLAIEYFEEATRLDPAFGRAWSGLANSYVLAATGYGWLSPDEAIAEARRYGEKALELDPDSGATISLVGDIAYWYDYDAQAAEAAYLRGIEVDPEHVGNLMSYSYFLGTRGYFDEAIRHAERAVENEPRMASVHTNLAWRLLDARRYDAVIKAAEAALAVDGNHAEAHWARGRAYAYLGRYDEVDADPYLNGDWLVRTLTLVGRGQAEVARAWLESPEISAQLEARPGTGAQAYAALGDVDRAFEFLDRAIQERHRNVLTLATLEAFDSLRDDPRYAETLQRVGLPTYPLF